MNTNKDFDPLLTGFDLQCPHLCVYSFEKEVGRALCTCPTGTDQSDFRTLDSFWTLTLVKLPIRPVWEQSEK